MYDVVADRGVPLKMVDDPSTRSCGVAKLPLPAAVDRLMMCTFTAVIASVRAPGSSKA